MAREEDRPANQGCFLNPFQTTQAYRNICWVQEVQVIYYPKHKDLH